MLLPGRYKAEHDGDIFHAYRYIMEVKETEKSYIFRMVEAVNRYANNQIETMFGEKTRVVLCKTRPSRHAIRVWNDHDFTIYPFQVGVPFHFQRQEQHPPLTI